MSDLFGVDIKGVVLGALSGQLHALTLHKVESATGDHGEPVNSEATLTGQGVRTKWRAEVAAARGFPAGTVKIIALQDGLPAPTLADYVTILGDRYRIIAIDRDPVNATWVIAGVPA